MTTIVKRKVNRNSDFIKTASLRKYRARNDLNNHDIAAKIGRGIKAATVSYWCSKGTVPRWVIQELGLKTWGGKRTGKDAAKKPHTHTATKSGGEIYISYVDRDKEDVFKAFCEALKINLKPVL